MQEPPPKKQGKRAFKRILQKRLGNLQYSTTLTKHDAKHWRQGANQSLAKDLGQ